MYIYVHVRVGTRDRNVFAWDWSVRWLVLTLIYGRDYSWHTRTIFYVPALYSPISTPYTTLGVFH